MLLSECQAPAASVPPQDLSFINREHWKCQPLIKSAPLSALSATSRLGREDDQESFQGPDSSCQHSQMQMLEMAS